LKSLARTSARRLLFRGGMPLLQLRVLVAVVLLAALFATA